jgi:hypothetical protein
VGDDRALPFRRVPDGVPKAPEKEYVDVDTTHATGAAIRENYYLTDDFFVDRQPTQIKGHEVYSPDLAIGRLVETPDDMIHLINGFLGMPNGTVQVDNILVTGYDFVNDVALENCRDWRKAMNNHNEKVTCLIDQPTNHWTKQQLMDLQLRTNSVFKVQSINGHAFHSGEGVAASGNSILRGSEIVAIAALDFGGGIIYTLGCHSGLNVPPTNSREPVDLAEAFARKGANYIGNTGFGYGLQNAIGLSEKLMRLYTAQLIGGSEATMGRALMIAKKQYLQSNSSLSPYDEKVMQQLVFYGLPMYKITGLDSPGSLGDDFPGVDFDLDPPSLGGETISRTVRINFQRAIDTGVLTSTVTADGEYLALHGSISGDADEPVQPLHFRSLSGETAPVRSVVILGGDIEVRRVENPLIGTPTNEYLPIGEATLDSTSAWYPAIPSTVQRADNETTLVTVLTQYNPETNQQFLYKNLEVDIYYSASSDLKAPNFTVVDGLYDPASGRIAVKVGAVDESGIKEVIVNYFEDIRQSSTSQKSVKLSFDASSQKWRGVFAGSLDSKFYVQAVDNAGNVRTENNKGNYFQPATARATAPYRGFVYLPLVIQQR